MNKKIFKAYDIRGIYPSELDEDTYYRVAQGYACIFKPKQVAVGRDARLSSPSLMQSLVNGLVDAGVDVVDIGEVTTDMIYFAVAAYGYSGGLIVSASHNPKEYNGIKMVKEKAHAISSDTGLMDILRVIEQNEDKKACQSKKGKISTKLILDDYIEHVLKFIDVSSIKPFTFVGNGNFGYVHKSVTRIVERLHLNMIPLNMEANGAFPKGPPDPFLPSNRVETRELVLKHKAAFAAAWDADADRVMFLDEKGDFISGAYIGALLAKILLEKRGSVSNKVLYDPRITWPMIRIAKEMKGVALRSKCGHSFIKDRMRAEDALFAAEMSAHYYFRDNFYADNGVIPFLLVLEHLSKTGKPFSEIMKYYTEGHNMSGEINYKVNDINSVKPILTKIEETFKEEAKDFLDGLSIEGDSWRFNIRASNTEPLIRLNIEAKDKDKVDQIKSKLEAIINAS